MTYGLSLWMPLHGVGSISPDPYDFRSGMGVNFSAAFNYYNEPSIWTPAAKLLNEYRSIRHLFSGDFYPLTPYSVSQDVWMAWQLIVRISVRAWCRLFDGSVAIHKAINTDFLA